MSPKKVLMLFPQPTRALLDAAIAGKEPTERLYGLIELRERGWTADLIDTRFSGVSGWTRRRLSWLLNPIDWRTVLQLSRYDVLVVKDDFSISAACGSTSSTALCVSNIV